MTKEQAVEQIVAQMKEGWDQSDPMTEDDLYFMRRYLTKGWEACEKQMFTREDMNKSFSAGWARGWDDGSLGEESDLPTFDDFMNTNYPNK